MEMRIPGGFVSSRRQLKMTRASRKARFMSSKWTHSEMLLHIVVLSEHFVFDVNLDRVVAGYEAFQRNCHTERVAIVVQLCGLLLLERELHRCATLRSLSFD